MMNVTALPNSRHTVRFTPFKLDEAEPLMSAKR